MPGKKKGKKGKKKGKKSGGKAGKATIPIVDPVTPEHIVQAPRPGERLIKLLTTKEVKEKELFGMQITTEALENLTPQEIQDLHVVFEAFDIHDREYIGATDLRRAMRALGFKVTRENARKFVQDASVQGRGMVNFNEFLDIIIHQQGDSRDIYEEIMQGFKMFDYEHEDKISLEDLKTACRETGIKYSKQELQDMMEEADVNGDGFVDKEEFVKIMLQTNLF